MDELLAFLRARLYEDEKYWKQEIVAELLKSNSAARVQEIIAAGDHAKVASPWHRRMLVDVEAKRQIVELIARPCPECLAGLRCVPHDASAGPPGVWRFVDLRDEYIARSLSLPFADHPDYREAWRP